MYCAFKLLGTGKNKLYIWMAKVEYFKVGDKITHEGGDAVGIPIVLNIRKNGRSLSIINHEFPGDGEQYDKSLKKLFSDDVIFPSNDEMLKLNEVTRKRAEENFSKGL